MISLSYYVNGDKIGKWWAELYKTVLHYCKTKLYLQKATGIKEGGVKKEEVEEEEKEGKEEGEERSQKKAAGRRGRPSLHRRRELWTPLLIVLFTNLLFSVAKQLH